MGSALIIKQSGLQLVDHTPQLLLMPRSTTRSSPASSSFGNTHLGQRGISIDSPV
jgi:hypothetical protein